MSIDDFQNFKKAFSDFFEFLRGSLSIAQKRIKNTSKVGLKLSIGEF